MSASVKPEGPISSSVERLRNELDKWMELARSQGERAIDAIGLRSGRTWTPPIDIVELPDQVEVYVSLPGVRGDQVELTLTGHMLSIHGSWPSLDLGEAGESHVAERPVGEFQRSIPLPASVDPDTISATCADGVLHVRIRKTEQERARKIPVQTGGASPQI
jgi:HSP20 family protein